MDSSDSEEHEHEEESMKYNYVMDRGQLKEIKRYSGGRIIAKFSTVLHNFGGNYIPAGQYSFPFSFKTGDHYPASYRVHYLSSKLRTNQKTKKEREESNTKCKFLSEDSTQDLELSKPSKKSLSEKLRLSKTRSKPLKLMSLRAAAVIKVFQEFNAILKKMLTVQDKMPKFFVFWIQEIVRLMSLRLQ